MKIKTNLTPLRTALIYTLFGGLWILFTDLLVELNEPVKILSHFYIQSIKGWLFVFASASLIYLILSRDMKTLQKKQEQIRYQARLVEDVFDAIISTDMQFHIQSWNAAAERMYGWKASEVLGHFMHEFVQNEYISAPREEILKSAMEQGRWKGEVNQNHKDGRRFTILTSLSMIKDPNGEPIGFVSVNHDMTEIKRAQQEAALLARFPAANPNPVMRVDLDGHLIYANKASAPLLELWGCEVNGYLPQEYAERIAESATGSNHNWADLPCGDHTFSMMIVPIHGENYVNIYAMDISDRKQAEAALRESEDKFKYIFDYSMIGKSITLPGGEVNVNRAFCEMLGYPAEELRNKKWQELSHPDDNEMTQKIIDSILSGEKESARFIKRYLHKNGTSVWADVSSSLRRDRDGKPLYFITSMSDITERRRAEAALRTSEEKHRLVVDQASEGIAIAQDQKIKFSNASFAAMLGYELDEMEGREFIRLIPPENMDLTLERYKKRLTGEPVPATYESVLLHKNGTRIPMDINATLIQYEGNPADLVIIRDITERKQAEVEYRTIIKTAMDGFWITDTQGHFLDVNPAYCQLIGYSREELLKMSIPDVEVIENPQETAKHIQRLLESGYDRFETQHRCKDGRIIDCEISANFHASLGGRIFVFLRDISERKQAEEALEWMRSTLAEAQKIAHMGSFEYIAATQTTTWSEEEYRIYGLDPSEPSPSYDMMLQKYIHPDDAALLHETFTKAMQSHTVYELEHRVVRPDGSVRWVYDLAQPYFDEQGELIRYIGSTLDITERKQAEEKLHESETRYRLISENSADVIWTLDLATRRFTYVSPSVFNLRGLTPEEVMAEPMQAAITPESNEQISENLPQRIARYLSGDISARTTTKLVDQVHKDGSIIPTEAVTNLITDSEGKVVEVLGITRDITLRKKAEEALRKSQTQLQAIIDYSPSLISIKDLAGNILLANRSFDMLDAPPLHELIGKNVFDIFPKEVAEPLWNNDLAALQAKGPVRSEEVVKHKDGHWHTYWTVKFPIYLQSDQPFGICAISNDITERKQAEEQLLKTLEELKRSNNELEQFAYVASHDLQEPLRAVAGMVQLLQKRYQGKLDDRADEYITLAMDGANRMQTLIKDLLEYSRVDRRGNPIQPIDANMALKSALRNLEASIQQSGAIVTTRLLPTVDADATQLAQLFQNLIGNAIKFRSERPPQIYVEVKDLGNVWQFSVRDNGIGIEPQYFERIFLVFQRLHTRREYPGTGIGLSICKKIVDRHGGRIWIESEPGQGTTFFFTIPQRS
ncbi:MAG: PAS domain S-box protein [Anaerolineales bacterium]|nr:PAS domain S-box protein [Anaerolineales bacterium]